MRWGWLSWMAHRKIIWSRRGDSMKYSSNCKKVDLTEQLSKGWPGDYYIFFAPSQDVLPKAKTVRIVYVKSKITTYGPLSWTTPITEHYSTRWWTWWWGAGGLFVFTTGDNGFLGRRLGAIIVFCAPDRGAGMSNTFYRTPHSCVDTQIFSTSPIRWRGVTSWITFLCFLASPPLLYHPYNCAYHFSVTVIELGQAVTAYSRRLFRHQC